MIPALRLLVALMLCAVGAQDAFAAPPANTVSESNYTLCRDGAQGCDPTLLTPVERTRIRAVEDGRNFLACATGEGRCEWTRLTASQLTALAELRQTARIESASRATQEGRGFRESPAPAGTSAIDPAGGRADSDSARASADAAGVAENGSYYGEPNDNGVPKTVFVSGYYRKDGTYVRSHYRSKPGSNPKSSRRKK